MLRRGCLTAILIVGAIVGILYVLAWRDIAEPGYLSFTPPDAAVCRERVEQLTGRTDRPTYTEVRWVWRSKGYGWGCYYEFEDFTRIHRPYPKPPPS